MGLVVVVFFWQRVFFAFFEGAMFFSRPVLISEHVSSGAHPILFLQCGARGGVFEVQSGFAPRFQCRFFVGMFAKPARTMHVIAVGGANKLCASTFFWFKIGADAAVGQVVCFVGGSAF